MEKTTEEIKKESILDTPKTDLDNNIWEKDPEKYEYVLKPGASSVIDMISKWVVSTFKLTNPSIRLVGSITSNSYSEESDIDIHFSSTEITEENQEKMNRSLRASFDVIKEKHPEISKIGTHPIELYFQTNPFQDMMSVGCYDFIGKTWIVGPEFKGKDFDPYTEYYEEDMALVDEVISEIRNVIFRVYEYVIVMEKTKDLNFQGETYSKLIMALEEAKAIYDKARETRKVYSAPTSKEDALEKRSSRKWHIADSAFKLLDKFGYLAILKGFATNFTEIQENGKTKDEVLKNIKELISTNIKSDAEDLTRVEDRVDESFGAALSTALMAGFLAIPGVFQKDDVKISSVPNVTSVSSADEKKYEDWLYSDKTQNEIRKSDSDGKSYGGMKKSNVINMVARTIYAEAHGEVSKFGDKPLEAIASVIWNRAGGDPNNFVSVISRKSQFSSWGSYKGGWDDKTYLYKVPFRTLFLKSDRNIWNTCLKLATDMVDGKFKDILGGRNMIANRKLDNKEALKKWGYACDLNIGNHWFGYQKDQDGFKKGKNTNKNVSGNETNKVHTVKKGDSLDKIAKVYSTTTDELLKKNPEIKDKNRISIGQKIRV